ncbi:MAG: hypothetical protein KY454_09315 [Actinobacteria bacterium]|nr:hypothetical protein [Actinomycetota bacterium]
MPKTDPAELDRIAVQRHGNQHTPTPDPHSADEVDGYEAIVLREQNAYTEATKGIEGASAVVAALEKARSAAQAKAAAFEAVKDALPSDRAAKRQQAEDMPDPDYSQADAALVVLEREASLAALPKPPNHREYAQVADELRMLLNGKTKEQVVDIATRPRYVGLMARDFGRAWCEANLDADLAKLTHEAIVAKATNGASTKAVTAAKRAMAARKAANWNRLRAAGAKQ